MIGTSISINANEKIYFKAGNNGNNRFSKDDKNYYYFVTSGKFAVYGNINTLLNNTGKVDNLKEIGGEYCFFKLFSGCSITQAPKLPATELAKWCYGYMFEKCTDLDEAPILPAIKLADRCYHSMFINCSKLTTIQTELPATELFDACYASMFRSCSMLSYSPILPATELKFACYANIFEGCTSLTQAPELPATTLAERCYDGMFKTCTSLKNIPANELPATTLQLSCYKDMFNGCTSLTQAPVLPATELVDYCYNNMFNGCSNLDNINVGISAWGNKANSNANATTAWLNKVAKYGEFVYTNDNLNIAVTRSANAIPANWIATKPFTEDIEYVCFTATEDNT